MFTRDWLFRSGVQKAGSPNKYEKSGNEQFVTELSKWVFHERGHLKAGSLVHHRVGETDEPAIYRIKYDLVWLLHLLTHPKVMICYVCNLNPSEEATSIPEKTDFAEPSATTDPLPSFLHENNSSYLLIEEGPCEELSGDGESAFNEWILHAKEFDGLCESLIYESGLKQRLLRYAASALIFTQKGVNPNLVSWNRSGRLPKFLVLTPT